MKGVLQHQPVDLVVFECSDEFFRAVKADEDDTAGEARVLQGTQHAKCGGFVGAEDALDGEFAICVFQGREQVFAGLIRAFCGGAAVISMSECCQWRREIPVRVSWCWQITQHDDFALCVQALGQVLFLVEIIEACGFNQQQARLGILYRVSSPS